MATDVIRLEHLSDLYPDPPLPLTRDVYWMLTGDGVVLLAHVCTHAGSRWIWQGTQLHRIVSIAPLTLEPSIGWQACCGRHGFIQSGQWIPSPPDGGFQP